MENQFIEEATWEAEEDINAKYPHLFMLNSNDIEGTGLTSILNLELLSILSI